LASVIATVVDSSGAEVTAAFWVASVVVCAGAVVAGPASSGVELSSPPQPAIKSRKTNNSAGKATWLLILGSILSFSVGEST
jgi:hypothetical protein